METRKVRLEIYQTKDPANILGVKVKDEMDNVVEVITDAKATHVISAIDTLLKTSVPIGKTVALNITLEDAVETKIKAYTFINGDLLKADADVIVHQVNCMGVMGSGVAKAIRNIYPQVYDNYRLSVNYHNKNNINLLGKIQSVEVNTNISNTYKHVVNMFAQNQFGYDGKVYTSIDAFKECLEKINREYKDKIVAFPWMIGCVRGGANWSEVLPLICNTLTDVKEIKFYNL